MKSSPNHHFNATNDFVLVRRLRDGGIRVISLVTSTDDVAQEIETAKLLADGIEQLSVKALQRGESEA